ncbi:MAG: cytochrome c [Acidobacteriota bacterium]
MKSRATTLLLALVLVGSFGCRQGMFDQAKYEPLEKSDFFDDGASARPLPANTIARGFLRDDRAFWFGVDADGQAVDRIPRPVDAAMLKRGQQRYAVFCSPCHGMTGEGNGVIVQRGYPVPSSFHEQRLRDMPDGYFFSVISEGFGRMPSYRSQITAEDRWAITAFLRVLQQSQGMSLEGLPAAERRAFEEALAAPADEHDSDHGASAH